MYEDHNFNTPHYQSLRPRTIQSFIETQESSQIPQERPSMFSWLSAISDQSTTNTCEGDLAQGTTYKFHGNIDH